MSIFIVGYLCIGTYSRKYEITGASFQRAIIEDDTLFNDKLIYLLDFEVDGCDEELTLNRCVLPPFLYGCADIVKRISVTDSNNKEIQFIYEGKKTYNVDIEFRNNDRLVAYPLDAGKEFKNLVKDINLNSDEKGRFYIHDTRYYLIDDKNVLPKHMKIYLDKKVIDCTVNNNPVIIRNMIEM